MLNPSLSAQLDALRAKFDAGKAPGGIALWWSSAEPPNGSINAPAVDQLGWQTHYGFLEAGSGRLGQVPPLTTMQASLGAIAMDDPVPVAIACYRTGGLKSDFRAQVQAAAAAGQGLDQVPDHPMDVIEERLAVMACCPMSDQWDRAAPAYRGRVVRFHLDQDYWFTNFGTPRPREVHIDPGDNKGERTLQFGEELTCVYPSGGGQRQIAVRFNFGGVEVTACTSLNQVDESAPPPADTVWSLVSGLTPVGRAWIHRATQPETRQSLIVLVEGFPGGYAPGYLYEMFNQYGMVDTWRDRGYDVALIGFNNGMGSIESNAKAVQSVITKALAPTMTRGAYTDIVVGAVSMGGLVARYALTSMEAYGVPHNTRVFFTIDTPHQGAYTSLAIQWFVHYFAPALPLMRTFKALLDCPANQQFVSLWVNEGEVKVSPLRQRFVDRLKSLGNFPSKPMLLGLASGRGDGVCGIKPGAPLVHWTGSPFAGGALNALPEPSADAATLGDGYCYLADGNTPNSLDHVASASFEGVPGGFNTYLGVAAYAAMGLGCGKVEPLQQTSTSIPTVSALDIAQDPTKPIPAVGQSGSPFDDYVFADKNLAHVNIAESMSQWLIDKIGNPPAH